jgi:hypothetical protein
VAGGALGQAHEVLAFVRERGVVHPREVDRQFDHGKTRNWFGGSSNASTQLLDGMHYRGLLRVARREGGTRCYAARDAHDAVPDPAAALDTMVDVIVAKYAPLPSASLGQLVSHLSATPRPSGATADAARSTVPGAACRPVVVGRPRLVLACGREPGVAAHQPDDRVRLLAPFDPVVWDRRRFEAFWGWPYRFEAYTPAPRACSATTRCRCCGATVSWAGPTWAGATGACRWQWASSAPASPTRRSPPRWTTSYSGCTRSWAAPERACTTRAATSAKPAPRSPCAM